MQSQKFSIANLLFEALLRFIYAICQTFWQSQYFALSSNFLNHGLAHLQSGF
jgi:hypothetical protein